LESRDERDTQEYASRLGSLDRQVSDVRADIRELRNKISTEPTFSFLGFFIKRTTDFVAILALVLSVFGLLVSIFALLVQGSDYYERVYAKPQPKLFAPQQIVLYNSDNIQEFKDVNVKNQILFAAITSYINTASKDHDALVKTEFLRANVGPLRAPGMRIVQRQVYETGNSDTPGKFIFDKKGVPIPFVVPGNGAFRHEVLFYTHQLECVQNDWECEGVDSTYDWTAFIKDMQKQAQIAIEIGAVVEGQDTPLIVSCFIELKPGEIDRYLVQEPYSYWPECKEQTMQMRK
jgi:hypothetical protein